MPTVQEFPESPADIIRRLMIELELGLLPPDQPWPIFATHEPSAPDNAITVFDTSGQPDGRLMKTSKLVHHPGIMIRVRSEDYSGQAKLDEIRCTLASPQAYDRTVTIGSNEYTVHCLSKFSGISPSVEKITERKLFTLEALVSVKKVS